MLKRKVVEVHLPLQLIGNALITGWDIEFVRCLEGIPPDAALVGARINYSTMNLEMQITHESFTNLEPDEQVPVLGILYEQAKADRVRSLARSVLNMIEDHEVDGPEVPKLIENLKSLAGISDD